MSLASFINTGILKNPVNWVIVFLMVALGAMFIAAISPAQEG